MECTELPRRLDVLSRVIDQAVPFDGDGDFCSDDTGDKVQGGCVRRSGRPQAEARAASAPPARHVGERGNR